MDFELPKPRTDDPNYVPTPPKVSIGTVDAFGKATITFSEPVFKLENMTTRTINTSLARRLASKPFIDI